MSKPSALCSGMAIAKCAAATVLNSRVPMESLRFTSSVFEFKGHGIEMFLIPGTFVSSIRSVAGSVTAPWQSLPASSVESRGC